MAQDACFTLDFSSAFQAGACPPFQELPPPYMCEESGNMPPNKQGSLSKKEGKSGSWRPLHVSAEKTLSHRDPPRFGLVNLEVFIVEA